MKSITEKTFKHYIKDIVKSNKLNIERSSNVDHEIKLTLTNKANDMMIVEHINPFNATREIVSILTENNVETWFYNYSTNCYEAIA